MNLNLFSAAYAYPTLLGGELRTIAAAHTRLEFRKNDLFLRAGARSNAYYLLESGMARAYVHDVDGREITTEFFGEGMIVIEVSSLFQRMPTRSNLQALTDGVAWRIEFDDFQALFHSIEGFREWGRAWMANQLFLLKQRSIDMLTLGAAERYLNLLEEQPDIIARAHLKHVASYLGITDTSLSRIRREISGSR